MTTAYFVPSPSWSERAHTRALKRIRERFGEAIHFFQNQPSEYQWTGNGSTSLVSQFSPELFRQIVCQKGSNYVTPWLSQLPVYEVDASGCLLPHPHCPRCEEEHPQRQEHIFGRLAGPTPGEFKFFPYGYLGFHPGRGALDRFGFRIPFDFLDLQDRPDSHRVIALFGGSTAFSTHCHDHEMFSSRLEHLLNEDNRESAKISVLNFGQVGSIVLQNIFTWILFSAQIRPDFVICHSGWNDLCLGLSCDPVLMADHHITYLYQMEAWAQTLHGTGQLERSDSQGCLKIANPPEDVIGTWLYRVKQFQDCVEKQGASFLLGFQPALCSKGAPHPNEARSVANGGNNPDLRLSFERMNEMMDRGSQSLGRSAIPHIDMHSSFKQFGEYDELFADRMHCWPEGDAVIAKLYAIYLKNHWRSGCRS